MKPDVLRRQRRPDAPRLGWWLLFFLLLSASVSAIQIMRVHWKAGIVQLGYALPEADRQRFALEDEQARLRIELAAHRRLDRLEHIAQDQLGMEYPLPGRMIAVGSGE